MTTARDRLHWAQKRTGRKNWTQWKFITLLAAFCVFALRQFSDITATLEATAPRNPSEQVLFTAVAGKYITETAI